MRVPPLLIIPIAFLGLSAWALQDDASTPPNADDTVAEAESAAEPEAAQEPVVDDVFYQDLDDKDFRPSEDIPADQSIPFPTDI